MCSSPNQPKAAIVLVPELILPYDNSTDISLAPLFKWKNNANKLQISVNRSFSTVQYDVTVTGTQHQMPGGVLLPNTWYYWRAGIISGTTTIWADPPFIFETGSE
jgi:hypothetical protein